MKEWSKAVIEELELRCTEFSTKVTLHIDDQYACTNPDCPGAAQGPHDHFSFS